MPLLMVPRRGRVPRCGSWRARVGRGCGTIPASRSTKLQARRSCSARSASPSDGGPYLTRMQEPDNARARHVHGPVWHGVAPAGRAATGLARPPGPAGRAASSLAVRGIWLARRRRRAAPGAHQDPAEWAPFFPAALLAPQPRRREQALEQRERRTPQGCS